MQFLSDTFCNHRVGIVALRTYLAVAMLFHGYAKLINGIDGIVGMLTQRGLPGALAYLVYVGEVLAPALLLVGAYVRPAAWVIAGNMVVAVVLVHMDHLTGITKTGGWQLELQGFYFVSAITVAMTAHLARVDWVSGNGVR